MQPLRSFLNVVSDFGFTILFKKLGKRKKEDDTFLTKKKEEKQKALP